MKRTIVLIIAVLLNVFYLGAQNMHTVDSLQRVVATTKNDTVKLRALIQLCWNYRNSKIDSALKYNDEAYLLAERMGLKRELTEIINYKGVIYRNLGEYPKALEYYLEALKVCEQTNDPEQYGFVNQSIGDIYRHLKNTQLAKEYTFKGLGYFKGLNNLKGMAYCYYSLGSICIDEGELESAMDYLIQSMEIREQLSDQRGVATVKSGIARIFYLQNKQKEALDFFNQTISIYTGLNDYTGVSRSLTYRSQVYMALKDYNNAIKDIFKSNDYAEKLENKPVLRDNYLNLSKCYESQWDFKKAYDYHITYTLYNDSIQNDDKRHELTALASKYEQERQERENIKKELQHQKSLTQQRILSSIFITGFILMLIITYILIKNNLQKVRTNKLLEQQKFEIENKKKELQEAYDELNLSNKKLQVIFDSPTVGIGIADSKGNFNFCNNILVEMTGYTKEDLLKMNYIEFVSPAERVHVLFKFRHLLKGIDNKISVEIRFQRKDKSLFWGNYTGASIKDNQGNVKMIVGIVTNIDNLKQSEEKLKQSYHNVQILSEIGKQVTGCLNVKTIVQTVYQNVNTLMDAFSFVVGVYNENYNRIDVYGIENGETLPFKFYELSEVNRLAVVCFNKKMEIVIHDMPSEYKKYINEYLPPKTGIHSRSIIYSPLTIGGKIIGVISAQSQNVSAYKDFQIDMLRTIGAYTSIAIENSKMYANIEEQNFELSEKNIKILEQQKKITDSIVYASFIQNAILQKSEILSKYFPNNFILFKPQEIVSGDFYYINEIDNHLIIAAVDCTGHGVPGAFMSILGFSFLNEIVSKRGIIKANNALNELRESVKLALGQHGEKEDLQDGMDISLISINLKTNKAEFAGAFNPIWVVKNSKLVVYEADKQPIRLYFKEKPFTNNEIILEPGDMVYLFSDGYYSQIGGDDGSKMKLAQFKETIQTISGNPINRQKELLEQKLDEWKGSYWEQTDDILVIGIEV
jgi:PAS domain S-box-containing protein